MPIDFPNSPTNGQTFTVGEKVWIYQDGKWQGGNGPVGPTGATGPGAYTVSATAPVSPNTNAIWYNSTDGRTYLYYNDGNTSQWVEFGNANVGNQLAGEAARPLLTGGARLSGSGLELTGLASNFASSPDSAALDITGDIDIKVKVAMTDWTPSAFQVVVSKWGAAGQRSFYLYVTSTGPGYVGLSHSADGTNELFVNSTAAPVVADGDDLWIRATLDVDNGSSQRVHKFYTSSDGTTWTQLGSTVTTAGTTSIFNSTTQLEVGTRVGGLASNALVGTVYRTIIQSGFDNVNNTNNLVYDANFSTATADALAFTGQSGTGIKADGLVLAGRTGEFASSPDSAALSITGDIDIKAKVTLSTWTPIATTTIAMKTNTTGNQSSWLLNVTGSGALSLQHSEDGATFLTTTSVASGLSAGTTKWVRVTMDVNDGAGNRVHKFYLSDNGTTWTQLGTTITTAGTTSIFDSTAQLAFPRDNGSSIAGTYSRLIIQSAFDTANNTSNLAFDADFDAQAAETSSFIESSANAATVTVNGCYPTVTINTTRYFFGIPNQQVSSTATTSLTANETRFSPFIVTAPVSVDMVFLEVTTAPTSTSTFKAAIYTADNNFQAVGTAVVDFGSVTVATSTTGVYTKQIAAVTLQSGSYLIARNASVAFTLRTYSGGVSVVRNTIGGSMFARASLSQPNASFPSSSPVWSTTVSASATFIEPVLRWNPA